jgi:hypothetical protein
MRATLLQLVGLAAVACGLILGRASVLAVQLAYSAAGHDGPRKLGDGNARPVCCTDLLLGDRWMNPAGPCEMRNTAISPPDRALSATAGAVSSLALTDSCRFISVERCGTASRWRATGVITGEKWCVLSLGR